MLTIDRRISSLVCVIGALCAAAMMPLTATAQPLADHVPADAIVYVGWAGGDKVEAAYEDSHLADVAEAYNLDKVADKYLAPVRDFLAADHQQWGEHAELSLKIADALRRYPTGFYFGGLSRDAFGHLQPVICFVSQVGKDNAEQVTSRINAYSQLVDFDEIALHIDDSGDGILRITLGVPTKTEQSLADHAGFKNALKQTHQDSLLWVYVSIDDAVKLGESIGKEVPEIEKRFADDWKKAKENSGLDGVHRVMVTVGFDGKDWLTAAFVDAPSPRRGFVEQVQLNALDDAALAAVPAGESVSAIQVKPESVAHMLRNILESTDPRTADLVDQHLNVFTQLTGGHLDQNIIESLSDQWFVYRDGGAESPLVPVAVVSKLDDPAKFVGSMQLAIPSMNQIIQQRLDEMGTAWLMPQIVQETRGDVVLWKTNLPAPLPAIAAGRGHVAFAGTPDDAVKAIERVGAAGNLAKDQQFLALRKRLGAEKSGTFWYADLKEVSKTDPLLSPAALPQLEKIQDRLGPAGTFMWMDDHGWHLKSSTPYPGADFLASPLVPLVVKPATMLSVFLPR